MNPPTVILITGHPATGKTTLAKALTQELALPLLYRDRLKETLGDVLGWSTDEWSRRLGSATWKLLYDLVDMLLQAKVSHIVESNFDPNHDSPKWQVLYKRYSLHLIQLRCEAEPEIVLVRNRRRVETGQRHPIHHYDPDEHEYRQILEQGHIGWLDVPGERISINTGNLRPSAYHTIAEQLRQLLGNGDRE